MRTRSTIALLLLAVGLFFGIRLYESKNPSRWERATNEGYVLQFKREDIDGIDIESNGEKIRLRRNENGWQLEAPIKDRADVNVVNDILTQCVMLRKEATLDEKNLDKKALKDFGVAKSPLRLKLLGKDAPPELLFGKETAIERKIYLRLENSKTVYVVSEELKNLISRKVNDFRDRKLSTIQGPHVNRVVVKTAAGEMELNKEGSRWKLTKPLQTRANEKATIDLIGSVLQTPIVDFVQDQANLNTYGLAEPRATVTLWSVSQDEPLILEVGAKDEKSGNVYARVPGRNLVCLVPERVQQLLTLKPNDLRDRQLLRVEMDILDRITIAPANQPKVVLQRDKESWLVLDNPNHPKEGKPANDKEIGAMLDALQKREIKDFVNDIAADLAPYGLDQPQLRVVFSSYASDNTAESTAGEHPIVTLAFGKVEGDIVYARAENEPFVVSIDKSVLELIPTAPVAWLSAVPFRFSPSTVSKVELVKGEKRVSFSPEEGKWNNPQIESLVNTLSRLTALRRLPEAPQETRGQIIVTVTGRDQPITITLGPPEVDGACPIAVEGEPGAFLVSAPDASALRQPLPE